MFHLFIWEIVKLFLFFFFHFQFFFPPFFSFLAAQTNSRASVFTHVPYVNKINLLQNYAEDLLLRLWFGAASADLDADSGGAISPPLPDENGYDARLIKPLT